MWWDIAGSLLGDSPKESGSSLGTRREIAEKKTGGLTVRLLEVAGVCGTEIRKVEGTTFAKILTGKPPVSDGWTARTIEFGWLPVGVDG
ncbi:hypothetical protein BHE74_00054273 [Ensete ventricosum]|nr:hypothetical protein BHE74_00054273 [Ensete ventricosum]